MFELIKWFIHSWKSRPRRQMIELAGDQFRLGTNQRPAIETKRRVSTINVGISFQILPLSGENRYNSLWWLRRIDPKLELYAQENPDKLWWIVGFIPAPNHQEHTEIVMGFFTTYHRADYWLDQIIINFCAHASQIAEKCQVNPT